MIRFARIPIGSGGGLGCRLCGPDPEPAEYLSEEEALAAIREAAGAWEDAPGPNLSLAGAEPFGHPALPALVSAAIDAGVQRLRLETDAAALASGDNAEGCLAAGVRHVRFPLLAGSGPAHDALVGQDGAFDATLAGVEAFVAAARRAGVDVCVTARVPICSDNLHELAGAVGAAASVGAASVTLVPAGDVDLEKAAAWIGSALDTGVVNSVWTEVFGVPADLLPGRELHVVGDLVARLTERRVGPS